MSMTNDEMIEMLVTDDFDSIMSGDATELLYSYLEFGHKGYRSYSTKELIAECIERGLATPQQNSSIHEYFERRGLLNVSGS